jgi:hypothetical protein
MKNMLIKHQNRQVDQDLQMSNIWSLNKTLAKPNCNIKTKQTTQHMLLTQTHVHNTHNKKPKK